MAQSISAEFTEHGTAQITVNGISIEISPGGDVVAYTNGSVEQKDPVSEQDNGQHQEIGQRMDDGTIYAGVDPENESNDLFTTPKDVSSVMKWNAAMKYAADLDVHGHQDWKLPNQSQLNVLYKNKDKGALSGTFNETGSYPVCWYWSSSELHDFANRAWMQRFNDGNQNWDDEHNVASLRPVRSVPRLEA